jgi:hypothetical protein
MFTLLTVVLVVVPAVLAGQAAPPGVQDVNVFATAAVGFVASLLLGAAKGTIGRAAQQVLRIDTRVTNAIKPVQPLLLFGLAWGLPQIGAALGIVPPDATDLVSAPLATVLGVTAREGMRRLFGAPDPAPAVSASFRR